MGFLDKLLGRDTQPVNSGPVHRGSGAPQWDTRGTTPGLSYTDDQALARYRYMLKTAPPEALEEAHAEAFAKLTPEQRQLLLQQLSEAGETPQNDDPRNLARAATRAEMRQPGTLERSMGGGGMMGGMGGGMMGGMGGMIAGSLLASIAGTMIASSIAHSFFSNPAVASDYNGSADAQSAGDTADPAAESSAFEAAGNQGVDSEGNVDSLGDPGDTSGDSGGDYGGDSGGYGGSDSGDFGGGDFGGGDFGGGDFGGDF